MEFLPHPEVNTSDWAVPVHQHEFPDWKAMAPDAFLHRGKRWEQNAAARPWFDQDGAAQKVEAMRAQGLITADEERLMLQWVHDGYFVIQNAIDDEALLDEYVRDLDDVWVTDKERPGLQFSGVRVHGVKRGPIAHAEVLSWPLDLRLHLRDEQTWRIHYYHPYSPAGMQLAKSRKLVRMCYLLLQDSPVLLNLTTYKYSSEVALHQDMWFYHLHPANHMVGIWLACEDVTPETGPLAVYPGSQKVGMWPGFSNYPQTNYRTCHPQTHEDIEAFLREKVAGTPRVTLPVKKGDAIFLNGLLVHDADKVQQRGARSRFSIVFHYTVPGANKAG
ncbi:MAG: phytanoyl-CoA dioxygenase family protein, partial [Thermoanaerobaculia bacterium]